MRRAALAVLGKDASSAPDTDVDAAAESAALHALLNSDAVPAP
ncbi:hypothetical protein OG361_31145 [Streptomyces sp. NBC_00090]